MQSAKFIVPQLLLDGDVKAACDLGNEVVKAAIAHPSAAAIEEAYRTVLLNPGAMGGRGGEPDYTKLIAPQALSAFLPVTLKLVEARVKMYGVETPPQPAADVLCVKFFVSPTVWQAARPQQQTQMKELMLGLLRGAARQHAAGNSKEPMEVIHNTGLACEVLGKALKNKEMSEAGHVVGTLNMGLAAAQINLAIDRLAAWL